MQIILLMVAEIHHLTVQVHGQCTTESYTAAATIGGLMVQKIQQLLLVQFPSATVISTVAGSGAGFDGDITSAHGIL